MSLWRRALSAIGYEPEETPENIEITTATMDDPNPYAPTREIWTSHRLAWEVLDPRLPQFEQGSGAQG